MRINRSVFILIAPVMLAACSGPRPARDVVIEPDRPAEETINHAAYEDFDPAPYDEAAREQEAIRHDVPASLMNNRTEPGATRTAQGFRVQITQTQDKNAADQLAGDASAWWREQADQTNAPVYFRADEVPVYVAYRQPYYRVRLGNFASQEEAQRAAGLIRSRFPGAAVVPDTVVLPR